MDDNALQADESEDENLRAMEKDIDEFLSSIREKVSQNTDPHNEGTCSEVRNEYDSISSDDCFENQPLPSRSDELGIQGHARKLRYRSFKNNHRMRKGNMKNYEKHKLRHSYAHEEWHGHSSRNFGKSSGDVYHHQKSISPQWRDEYDSDKFLSPRSDEFHQERSLSPRGDYDRGRSISPSGRNEHSEVSSVSPNRKSNYRHRRRFIPRGRHEYRRRNYYSEDMDESSQDSCVFKERNFHHTRTITSRSGSSDNDGVSQRGHSRESNSPIDWSESYDYDSDFENENSNQPWRLEENYAYMKEDRDGQDTTSLIAAFLRRAIACNPEIATEVTEACMALVNKPADGPAENDYECDRDSRAAYEEESGWVSPQSWRGSRSPSLPESLGASSSRPGFSHHSDRFHGHSKRSVLECSPSPDDRQAGRGKYNYPGRHKKARYSPDYKRHDNTRPSTAASQTQRARKRSFSEYSKNHCEEEFNLKGAVSWSIRKIRKQCEGESSSTVRRALLSLLEVHERECKMYLKKPEAHPDYKKEYREFVDQKTKSIVDLGGDPNGYNFEQDWKKYWPVQMYKLFQESWNTKMHSCTSLLQKKCSSGSKSSHSSSRKSTAKKPHRKKQRTREQESEEEAVNVEETLKKVETSTTKQELLEVTHSGLEYQQMLCKKQEEMNGEIFNILKLLNHIKHRFNDYEVSFDKLYVKAMSLKEDSVAIHDVLQSDLPLLEKIDENLKETLEDVNLTLIQKAVIQETHERFRAFLKKCKEITSHSMKSKDVKMIKKLIENMEASVIGTEGEHQIPCHLTHSCSSVVSSGCSKKVTVLPYTSCSCCGTNQQVSQPMRTLTEISLVGSSGPKSRALYIPEDASGASFQLYKNQNGIQCNRDFTSDVINVEKHASRPRRTLTEICLVGSSCPASSVTHKRNVILVGKDSDMTQPPPPGVTPPPPGVTPPPPGVTPPLLSVTPPPPGVTPPSSGGTPPPPGVTPPPPGVTLPPPGVATELPNVTASCGAASSSPSIRPPSPGITPSHIVTIPPCRVSAPPRSVMTTSHSVSVVPHYVTPQPYSSASVVALKSHQVTPPPPGVSLPSVGNGLQSSVLTLSQTSVLSSSSPLPAGLVPASQLANDEPQKASQHLSIIEQSCRPSKNKVTAKASKMDTPPQPSKELLRSTIKDCFLSSSVPEESSAVMSTKEGLLTIDTSAEGISVASVPSLSEDILKMFEVKPEDNDKVSSDDKGRAKMDNVGSSSTKSAAKKPIKITIPQFSKQKSMPELNPVTDDHELL